MGQTQAMQASLRSRQAWRTRRTLPHVLLRQLVPAAGTCCRSAPRRCSPPWPPGRGAPRRPRRSYPPAGWWPGRPSGAPARLHSIPQPVRPLRRTLLALRHEAQEAFSIDRNCDFGRDTVSPRHHRVFGDLNIPIAGEDASILDGTGRRATGHRLGRPHGRGPRSSE